MNIEYAGGYIPPLSETEQPEKLETITKTYETEIGPIEVKALVVNPSAEIEDKNLDPTKAIILSGGYGGSPDLESAGWLNQAYADKSKSKVHSLSTRTEQTNQPDSLYFQADAIAQYIEDNQLKEVILAGVSQGGAKSLDLASIIQEKYPNIKVDAVILNNPVGLYAQSKSSLISGFFLDGLMAPKSKGSAITASDTTIAFGGEIARSGTDVVKRAWGDVKEMATLRDSAQKITAPIYIVMGEMDLVANPKKAIFDGEKYKDFEDRSTDLQERVFPNSPHVEVIIAKKSGHHGAPYERSEAYAGVPLYRHERYKRSQNTETENNK